MSAVRSDVRVKKLYIGAMGISDQPFLPDYEDQNSTEFTQLASLVNQQVGSGLGIKLLPSIFVY